MNELPRLILAREHVQQGLTPKELAKRCRSSALVRVRHGAEVLRSMPANQRAVLVFVVLDDLPVAEAARLLGKSRGATESLQELVARGLQKWITAGYQRPETAAAVHHRAAHGRGSS